MKFPVHALTAKFLRQILSPIPDDFVMLRLESGNLAILRQISPEYYEQYGFVDAYAGQVVVIQEEKRNRVNFSDVIVHTEYNQVPRPE